MAEATTGDGAMTPLRLRLLALVTFGGALFLRVWRIGEKSFWYDEIDQIMATSYPFWESVRSVESHHGANPLSYALTFVLQRVTLAEWAHRGFPAFFGALTVALLPLGAWWWFRDRVVGTLTMVLAAAMLAVNPLHIQMSQEARFYALHVLLTVAYIGASWLWVREGRGLVAAGVFALLGWYNHNFMVLVPVAQLPWFFWEARDPERRRRLWLLLAVWIGVLVAFLPWLLYAVVNEGGPWGWDPPPWSPRVLWQVTMGFVGANQWAAGGLIVLMIAGLGTAWSQLRDTGLTLHLAGLAILPLPMVIAINRHAEYFFHLKQVLFLLPVWMVLAALGSVGIARGLAQTWRPLQALAVVPPLLIGVASFPALTSFYDWQKVDWRGAAEVATQVTTPQDFILVSHNFQVCFSFYYDGPCRVFNARHVDDLAGMPDEEARGRRLLLVHKVGRNATPEVDGYIPIAQLSGGVTVFGRQVPLTDKAALIAAHERAQGLP